MILNFRTTVFINGDEIFDPWLIAKDYGIGRFWIDFLSIFPFDIFASVDHRLDLLKIFGILKVIRVLRLGKLIEKLNIKCFCYSQFQVQRLTTEQTTTKYHIL